MYLQCHKVGPRLGNRDHVGHERDPPAACLAVAPHHDLVGPTAESSQQAGLVLAATDEQRREPGGSPEEATNGREPSVLHEFACGFMPCANVNGM